MSKQIFLLFLFSLALSAQQNRTAFVFSAPLPLLLPEDSSRYDTGPAPVSTPMNVSATHILPDAPEPRNGEEFAPAAYVSSGSKQPVAAIKTEPVFNKKFVAVHTAFLASIVYDAELTHQGLAYHKCVESNTELGPHPGRGTIYGQNMLAFGAISGLDWVAARFIKIPLLPYVTPAVASAEHITGGSKWLTECW
ncbi:MAG: hypothetical protein WB729_01925 [Candidatus Sulfotelmatobacter sp.]